MSTPPKASHHLVEGGAHRAGSVTSQATASAVPPTSSRLRLGRGRVEVEHRDFRAFRRHGPRRRRADGAAAAGDDRDLAAPAASPSPLPAWPVPATSIRTSNMSASEMDWNSPIASASVMTSTAFSAMSAAMPRRPCCGRGRTGRRPAPGSRAAADRARSSRLSERARCCARNSRDSRATNACTASLRRALEVVELARFRRRHDQRPVLGADGVVGRHHADLAVARQLRAVDIIEDRVAGAEVQDQPPPRAFALPSFERAGAAQDRRDLGERRDRASAAPPP